MKPGACLIFINVMALFPFVLLRDTSTSNMDKLRWLEGTWKSISAQGIYPTIPSFNFIETLNLLQPKNKPYFNYGSSTKNNEVEEKLMHSETGYLRMVGNTIILQLAHNFGLNTVEKGEYNEADGKQFTIETDSLVRAVQHPNPNKAKVVKVRRTFLLNDQNQLEQFLDMETDKTPMTRHLHVVYEKIST